MNICEFYCEFGPAIRTDIRWRLLIDGQFAVREVTVSDFALLIAPWYLDERGARSSYNHPQSRPITLMQAACLPIEFFEDHSYQAILQYMESFENGQGLGAVPAYALPGDSYLVLDGNHRLTALAKTRLPKVARVFAIDAPIDESLLPDLRHFRRD